VEIGTSVERGELTVFTEPRVGGHGTVRRLLVLALVLVAVLVQGATAAFAATPSFSTQPASPGMDLTPTWTFSVGGG
jgi:hypothetical protein